MTYETSDRPGLEEQYLLATSTSDLTLNPDRTCAATHLIAAGLSSNMMADALNRLRSDWVKAARPRKATEAEILARAGELPKVKGKPDLKRARIEALMTYNRELRSRAHGLRGWVPALSLLLEQAERQGWDVDGMSPALYHWIQPVCPVCDGRRKMVIAGSPCLSDQTCRYCGGSGEWPTPPGASDAHRWISRCLRVATSGRGALVRGGRIFGRE